MSAERDGGGACFNTGTVLGLNRTTQRNATMNSVINHIPVWFFLFFVFFFSLAAHWQKSTAGQTVAQRNALIGASEPGPRGESGRRTTRKKGLGDTGCWECERRRCKYSSYIYLWALLKSRQPSGPQRLWMRSFWKGTEWAIHKVLPCINTGRIFKPHLEAIAVSDANSNTSEKRKWSAFRHIPLRFLTFSFMGLDSLSKECTCPFHWLRYVRFPRYVWDKGLFCRPESW